MGIAAFTLTPPGTHDSGITSPPAWPGSQGAFKYKQLTLAGRKQR